MVTIETTQCISDEQKETCTITISEYDQFVLPYSCYYLPHVKYKEWTLTERQYSVSDIQQGVSGIQQVQVWQAGNCQTSI